MGIDIRDGQQMECITCALCIDTCDRVMDKVGRPRNLVSYSTLADYEARTATAAREGREAAKAEQKSVGLAHVARPRTILYFALWSLIGLVMLGVLVTRDTQGREDLHAPPRRTRRRRDVDGGRRGRRLRGGVKDDGELVRAMALAGFAVANIMLLSVSGWSGAGAARHHPRGRLLQLLRPPAVIPSGPEPFAGFRRCAGT